MLVWVPEDILRFAIYDGMRGVRLDGRPAKLSEEDRERLAEAIFARFQQAGWRVVRPDVKPHSTPG